MSQDKKKLVLKAIKSTRDILETHKWTKNHYAKDRNGIDCSHMAPHAVQFSVYGALHKALSVKVALATLAKVDPNKYDVLRTAEAVLNRGVWSDYWSIAEFNNDKATEYKDMIRVINMVIGDFDNFYDLATRR